MAGFRLLPAVVAWLLGASPALAGICAEDIDQSKFDSRSGLSDHLEKLGADIDRDALFTATTRIGDNRLDGVWELGLELADTKAEDTAQHRWSKSDDSFWQDFSLARDGARIILTLGRAVTELVDPSLRGIDTLALFATATGKQDEVRLEDLELNGVKLDKLEELGGGDQALLRGLSGDFVLSGQARMEWDTRIDGRDPNRMMLQVSGYSLAANDVLLPGAPAAASIPEPASAALLGAGVLALVGMRRKFRGMVAAGGFEPPTKGL